MESLFFSNIEYVGLRIARRLFPDRLLHRIGAYLPYYRVNLSESQPEETCRTYAKWLAVAGTQLDGQRILEVGSGATNGAGYALVASGAARVWCFEPFVEFDDAMDRRLLDRLAAIKESEFRNIGAAVTRCRSLDGMQSGSADLAVSQSVLEHVRDLPGLFNDVKRVLAPGGAMLHIVDYRDHFFKYPHHFLQFSTSTWNRFLDPGDLPRWRLYNTTRALEQSGFQYRICHVEEDPTGFDKVRAHVSPEFDLADPHMAVTKAVLFCTPIESHASSG